MTMSSTQTFTVRSLFPPTRCAGFQRQSILWRDARRSNWIGPRLLTSAAAPCAMPFVRRVRSTDLSLGTRYFQGELPGVFAIPAGVGDVLTGLFAPLVAYC